MDHILVKNICGLNLLEFVKPFTESDLKINRSNFVVTEESFKYLSENGTLDIEVYIKDDETRKQLDSILIKYCNVGVRFEYCLYKSFERPISKKGRGSVLMKINKIVQDVAPVLDKVHSYDNSLLVSEFNEKLQELINKTNQQTNDDLVNYFSKVSSFNLENEKNDEYQGKANKIEELQEALSRAQKDFHSYKTTLCLEIVEEATELEESIKERIKANLEKNRFSLPGFFR